MKHLHWCLPLMLLVVGCREAKKTEKDQSAAASAAEPAAGEPSTERRVAAAPPPLVLNLNPDESRRITGAQVPVQAIVKNVAAGDVVYVFQRSTIRSEVPSSAGGDVPLPLRSLDDGTSSDMVVWRASKKTAVEAACQSCNAKNPNPDVACCPSN